MDHKPDFSGMNPPDIEPTWKDGAKLGEKIEIALSRFLQRLVTWGWEWFGKFAVSIFDQSMKIMLPGSERVSDAILKQLNDTDEMPGWVKETLAAVANEKGEMSWISRLMVFYVTMRSVLFGSVAPYANIVNQRVETDVRSYLPDAFLAVDLLRRGMMSNEGFNRVMQRLGVADPLIESLYQYGRRLPTIQELTVAMWRGELPPAEFEWYLRRMGYENADVDIYKSLAEQVPPVQDVIRFMVRDAFNDNVVTKYGYDEDYPAEDVEKWAAKQGYAPEIARYYWRSHWYLPSPSQGYEMLHRGVITEAELKDLLKVADYPPYWRDKLMQISYNTFTRVDVRRMIQAGMMTADDGVKAYKEMGYDDDKATKLTEFAVKGISETEKDLTKSEVIGSFKDSAITEAELRDALQKMGYDSAETELLVKGAIHDIQQARRTDAINYTKERFDAKLVDEMAARGELGAAGLSGQAIDRYILAWKRAEEAKINYPSIAEGKRWAKAGIIDLSVFEEILRLNNVPEQYKEYHLAEVAQAKTGDENA